MTFPCTREGRRTEDDNGYVVPFQSDRLARTIVETFDENLTTVRRRHPPYDSRHKGETSRQTDTDVKRKGVCSVDGPKGYRLLKGGRSGREKKDTLSRVSNSLHWLLKGLESYGHVLTIKK